MWWEIFLHKKGGRGKNGLKSAPEAFARLEPCYRVPQAINKIANFYIFIVL